MEEQKAKFFRYHGTRLMYPMMLYYFYVIRVIIYWSHIKLSNSDIANGLSLCSINHYWALVSMETKVALVTNESQRDTNGNFMPYASLQGPTSVPSTFSQGMAPRPSISSIVTTTAPSTSSQEMASRPFTSLQVNRPRQRIVQRRMPVTIPSTKPNGLYPHRALNIAEGDNLLSLASLTIRDRPAEARNVQLVQPDVPAPQRGDIAMFLQCGQSGAQPPIQRQLVLRCCICCHNSFEDDIPVDAARFVTPLCRRCRQQEFTYPINRCQVKRRHSDSDEDTDEEKKE
ncbi:hypothetical protein NPIL_165131 [Nephila pilipes]|uniref:Uncharacterized protein n=1 Tax=Nephila pilipes TaxID=299642 RepID=A0A8X6U451_NEPPI|nr:hypothetical protein NPIL_165131 [Nephila pilipes]